MSGCRSCSGCAPESRYTPTKKPEKLSPIETSGNPRYPRVFVGGQAIYSDANVQMIVEVISDECDDSTDRFQVEPRTILRGSSENECRQEHMLILQPAGDSCWKLQALL